MTVLTLKTLFSHYSPDTSYIRSTVNKISFAAIIFLLLSLIASNEVYGQTKTWVITGNNNWNVGTNWSPAGVPTASNAVIIDDGATVNVDVAAVCASITINGTNNSAISVNIQTGQSLTVSGAIIMNAPANSVSHTLSVGAGTLSCSSFSMADTNNGMRPLTLELTTGTINISGNLTMLGAADENFIDFQGNGTLNIGLLFTATGGTVTPGTGTINYNGSVAQVIRAGTYNNLTLSGSGAKTITGATVTGTLSLQGTATPIGTSPTYAAGATLEYAGSAAQTTSNVEFNSAGVPTNLTLNNANGVTLHAARSISGTLSLTAGNLITTTANLLTLSSTATVTGGSKDSFIDGPLAKTGNTAFEFPTGASGIYAPILISAPSTSTDVFTAQYFRTGAPDAANISMGSGIDHVSAIEYWQLDRTVGSSDVAVTLSWRANSNVTDPSTIVVARFDGTNWTSEGNASNMGDSAGGSVTSNSVTSFSPFTLASTVGGASNPLPVELLSFTAEKKSKGVLLEWETATEVNNAFFQVERSLNGKEFDTISKVEGVGNSDITQSYRWLDENPRSGINYYRLKQVDFDGAFEYHPIVSVEMGPIKEASLQLFPNPSIDKVTVILPSQVEGEADLVIYNALGQLVKTTTIDLVKGNNNTELDIQDLAKGRYTMIVNYGGQRLTQAPLMIQR